MVNELLESKAIIFEMPRRVGVESETEEKFVCYFYKWKGGILANYLSENFRSKLCPDFSIGLDGFQNTFRANILSDSHNDPGR